MGAIDLTPGQAVYVFGWLRAKLTLRWADVVQHERITYRRLRDANVSAQTLFGLQPDVDAWIRLRKVTVHDCMDMAPWSPHPVKDFKVDVADMLSLGWRADQLAAMNVTFEDLKGLGVGGDNMGIFHFSLLEWRNLGFRRAHALGVSEASLYRLFGISKRAVLDALE